MNLRRLYVNDLIPAYQKMLTSLDNDVIGSGNMLKSVKDVCDIFNNLVDYIAIENPVYILESWNANNCKEFRDNLEKLDHKIMGINVTGQFFGVIRDIANTTKHLRIGRESAQIKSTKDVSESLSYIRYEDEQGYYYSYLSTVIAIDKNGGKIPVEVFLHLCFLSFTSILVNLAVIPHAPDILSRRTCYKSRVDAAHDDDPNFVVFLGEPFNITLSSYIYEDHIFANLRCIKSGDEFSYTLNINFITENGLFLHATTKKINNE